MGAMSSASQATDEKEETGEITVGAVLTKLEAHYYNITETDLYNTLCTSVQDLPAFNRALLSLNTSRKMAEKTVAEIEKKYNRDDMLVLKAVLEKHKMENKGRGLRIYEDVIRVMESEDKESEKVTFQTAIFQLGHKYVGYPSDKDLEFNAKVKKKSLEEHQKTLMKDLSLYEQSHKNSYKKQMSQDYKFQDESVIDLPPNIRKIKTLGAGAFATVYHCRDENTGLDLAVKFIRIITIKPNNAEVRAMLQEIDLMKTMSHRNVVQYFGSIIGQTFLCIFMEYMIRGTIKDELRLNPRGLDEVKSRMYTREVVSGLKYLHSKKVVHRDLKCANILINDLLEIKLADFGCSKQLTSILTGTGGGGGGGGIDANNGGLSANGSAANVPSIVGSPYWMAPEVIKQTGHDWRADIWGIGCVFVEMVTGAPPYGDLEPWAAMFKIATSDDPMQYPTHISKISIELLKYCLQKDPKKRPTTSQLLTHESLKNPENMTKEKSTSKKK